MASPTGNLAETVNNVRVSTFRVVINKTQCRCCVNPTLSDIGGGVANVKGRLARRSLTSFFK